MKNKKIGIIDYELGNLYSIHQAINFLGFSPSFVKNADLIVACCGVPHLVKKDWIKKDAIIIDVGINKIENNTGYKLVGDVDYDNVKNICSYITPVPGGVGPMTVAMLMKNVYELSQNKNI